MWHKEIENWNDEMIMMNTDIIKSLPTLYILLVRVRPLPFCPRTGAASWPPDDSARLLLLSPIMKILYEFLIQEAGSIFLIVWIEISIFFW